ncbi:MAG: Holliday junction branch migration DNA helicase RuvB [Leptospiraceae bacterium]|nr:Holliday junction branch migration DNA helicase RuvB [Leptospiraceae bacterium]MCP5500008.1 Holliday junction branch migration DNA helicase RuvB [Leptospiraceae bacterium]
MNLQDKRILDPDTESPDEISLRPEKLSDFIGQKENLENLAVFIEAARRRGRPLDHVLISGPPGLGKTTLASIIANEMGSDVTITSAKVVSSPKDLARFLARLEEKDILFIDEIHSLNRGLEEILYPAMEDYKIDVVTGEGLTAQTLQIPLKPFTLIGATTRSGMISEPLKNRFGIHLRLDYYSDEDMQTIVLRSAKILGIKIDKDSAAEIGKRSRKTPRIANHLLKRIRDFAEILSVNGDITLPICKSSLEKLGIDYLGLDNLDRDILRNMIERYNGGPVGLKSIAVIVGEEEKTIEESYEPYLVRIGLINRTPSGRIVSDKAYEHLGIKFYGKKEKKENDRTLFDR